MSGFLWWFAQHSLVQGSYPGARVKTACGGVQVFFQKMFFNVLSHYNHYMSCDLILSLELAFFLEKYGTAAHLESFATSR